MAVAVIPMAEDFHWDKDMQGHILGAYNIGRDLIQAPRKVLGQQYQVTIQFKSWLSIWDVPRAFA